MIDFIRKDLPEDTPPLQRMPTQVEADEEEEDEEMPEEFQGLSEEEQQEEPLLAHSASNPGCRCRAR